MTTRLCARSRTGTRAGTPTCALILFFLASLPMVAFAQQQPAADDERLRRLEQRLDELERQRQADQQEIARLRAQLDARAATTPATGPATAPALIPAGATPEDIEAARRAVMRHAHGAPAHDDHNHEPHGLDLLPGPLQMAITIDALGSFSPDRGNDAYNRFDVREVELDLRGRIERRADGVLILAVEREVENPLFPGDEEADEDFETRINIEEAYAHLHDFGVPGLTAKVGRFYLSFGRQNLLHPHERHTVDAPLVSQAFLSPEALADSGLSLSYTVPPAWIGGAAVELIAEIISGEGGSSESPVLAGDFAADSPAFNLHAAWQAALNDRWHLQVGGSFLAGHADEDNAHDTRVWGLDVTLSRNGSHGHHIDTLVQAELLYGGVDDQQALGAYLLAERHVIGDWYGGLRLDWTENPLDDDQERWAINPYVSWYWSELLRWRLQYQHRGGDGPSEDALYLQATFTFGNHRPHEH